MTSSSRMRSNLQATGGQAAEKTRGLLASIGGVPLHPKLAACIEHAAGLRDRLGELDSGQGALLRHLESKLRRKFPHAASPKKTDPLEARRVQMAVRCN